MEFVTHVYICINRPRLAAEDLKFFELAAKDEYGSLVSELLFEKEMPKIDLGDTTHVRTVVCV